MSKIFCVNDEIKKEWREKHGVRSPRGTAKKAEKQKNFFCLNSLHFRIHLLIKHRRRNPNGTHRRNDSSVKDRPVKSQDISGFDGYRRSNKEAS